MFQFLFKYPLAVFEKGTIVFLAAWPAWILAAAILAAAIGLGFALWKRMSARGGAHSLHGAAIWMLQSALAALLLLLLWRPALSVATLAPQQNVVAVVVDDSRSMGVRDNGQTRLENAAALLNGGLLSDLRKRFQVRLYQLGGGAARIDSVETLKADLPATRIGVGLTELLDGVAGLPLGAVVLLSDGSDNAGGIDPGILASIRARRVPVNTIGFGEDRLRHDVELDKVQLPSSAMAGSRLEALATVRQGGFAGGKTKLSVRRNGQVLASREIALPGDGKSATEPVLFDAGPEGVSDIEVSLDALPGETNAANNRLVRTLSVSGGKRRILYIEGEPRWEFKFLRRAVEDDQNLQIASMLRTTPNKVYRQGLDNPKELEDGFPSRVDDLFGYDGVIIGSVDAGYFTQAQRDLIREFVDRRGGGLLFLGGRYALADGGYDAPPFPDLLPVELPRHARTFRRDPAYPYLTAAGRDSLLCRIEDDPDRNVARWKNLPYLANFQDVGTPKPGATVLAEMTADNARLPLLVTENYGRGRTAVFATAGSWRWQMLQPLADMSDEVFWRQFLRWLVADTPGRVAASTERAGIIDDDNQVRLRAEVRDNSYLPAADAQVTAHISGPDGGKTVTLAPDENEPGRYSATVAAVKTGSYVAEIVASRPGGELGRGVTVFHREDGTAENFHQEQNRALLQQLASETGGHYYPASAARRIGNDIVFSEAGISTREAHDLWDMPAFFLLAILLRCSEWLLRRRWGMV